MPAEFDVCRGSEGRTGHGSTCTSLEMRCTQTRPYVPRARRRSGAACVSEVRDARIEAGGELDDWPQAEQELGTNPTVDLAKSKQLIHAMATVRGLNSSGINVAIEGRWLMALGSQELSLEDAPLEELYGMDWNRASGTAVAIREGTDDEVKCACAAGGEIEANEKDGEDHQMLRMGWGSKPFRVVSLSSEADAASSIAGLADVVLAVRMTQAGI